ncbi:MAG: thiamine biosynthesis protein ThiF [Coriobacteriia bacterium]|nr:thiamine biosynthesis protein ThiF [Coriobacteriia bacterium]
MVPSKEEFYGALCERHGADLQKKISAGRVAVCGLGGLGSNIAIALARAGVGHLHLIDFDRVDLTNLNRQQYFVRQLGLLKTDALRETLADIAPYCEVSTDAVAITEDNFQALLADDDIVCEAFDSARAKALLVNGVLEWFPEKYLLSSSGMAGMGSANLIQTRRALGRFYLCGDGVSDVDDGMGLVAPRVMACAAHEAHMVIRILAGELDS